MSLKHNMWRDDVIAIGDGSGSKSPRLMLADSRGPNMHDVRWGSPLTDTQRLDFLVALCEEMRGAVLDLEGNDQLEDKQLDSLLALINRVVQIDPEIQGRSGASARSALAAVELVFPYLDAHFEDLNDFACRVDTTQSA